MRLILIIAFLALPFSVLSAERPDIDTNLIDLIKQKHPTVKWDKDSIKKVDFSCDNKQDFALLGKDEEYVVVAFVIGPLSSDSRVLLSYLQVGKHTQDSLCGPEAKLSIEDQDYDPAENFGGEPLAGFRRSETCKGINVSGGECDSFHYFWNHDMESIQWWRL